MTRYNMYLHHLINPPLLQSLIGRHYLMAGSLELSEEIFLATVSLRHRGGATSCYWCPLAFWAAS